VPKLLIELTGVEYDRLCELARRERRTPNAQAAVVVGTTMAALAGEYEGIEEEKSGRRPADPVEREPTGAAPLPDARDV
jgi:hypothetical protein